MNLTEIFKKYYSARQIIEIEALLKRCGLYNEMNNSIKQYYHSFNKVQEPLEHTGFKQFLSEVVKTTTTFLMKPALTENTDVSAVTLLEAVADLISDAANTGAVGKDYCCTLLKGVIGSAYMQANDRLLLYYLFVVLLKNCKYGNGNIAEAKADDNIQQMFLKWKKKKGDNANVINRSNFASDIVDTLSGVETVNKILKMFVPWQAGNGIIMPLHHLCSFLTLFSLLHQCKRISCNGKRGLFLFLKAMLQAASTETLPQRKDYRKWNQQALTNYETLVSVENTIRPIFEKYCPAEEDRKLFNDFFSKKRRKALQIKEKKTAKRTIEGR